MAKHLLLAYFTGTAGISMGLFYFGDGIIAGADISGIKYDGNVTQLPDGAYEGHVQFMVPQGIQLVTGLTTDRQVTFTAPLKLPCGFDDGTTTTTIGTPTGSVNARFERLKELP